MGSLGLLPCRRNEPARLLSSQPQLAESEGLVAEVSKGSGVSGKRGGDRSLLVCTLTAE